MNILILNWKDIKNPTVGGAEVIAFEFARRLVKDGHKVIFFSRSFLQAKKREEFDGVKIIRKGNILTVYFYAFFYYRSLSKKPDKVIEMINTIAWQTPLYIPREKRIAYLNQLAKEVWFYEFSFPFSILGYIFERLQYITYITTDFLCYSRSTRNDLIQYGIGKNNIHIFPLGLDHKRYKKEKRKSNFPLFIFVARLVRMKRADLCVKAMRIVATVSPKAKLYIIGNGPEEEHLEKLVEEYKLQKNVVFVNRNNFFVDKNKKDIKVNFMQRAWALLLPSVKEGWGMVVTEAAACGTPSIVSDVTGLRDSVVEKKTGIILSPQPTPEEIAGAILRLIKDEKLRITMNRESLSWSKNFNWDMSYQEFKKQIFS